MLKTINKYSIIFFFLLVFNSVFSQTRISSPYSRYGVGDIQINKQVWSMAMGGISIAYRNPAIINFTNPASYSVFDTTSFVFETSIISNFSELKTNQLSQKSNYTTMGYLFFGFPVTHWWGASIGLLPYSNVGYKISDEKTESNIGKVKYLYEGYGGINRFYFGNSFNILKKISVGFNTSYLFGTLNKIRTISFPDNSNVFTTKVWNLVNVSDFYFDYGFQYKKIFKNKLSASIGLVFANTTKINVRNDTLGETIVVANEIEYVKDTILYVKDDKGNIIFPQSICAGLVIQKGEKWMIGADCSTQKWSKYTSLLEKDSLQNSMCVSIGGQYIPKDPTITGKTFYFNRINYRLGYRYSKTYLQLRNNQLTEQAICFGFGFPMKRSRSTINLGVELGKRGTTENNLIEERFIKLSISFGIKESWFMKRKYE